MSVKKYFVLYTVQSDINTVTVARIIYAGRDINKQLEATDW